MSFTESAHVSSDTSVPSGTRAHSEALEGMPPLVTKVKKSEKIMCAQCLTQPWTPSIQTIIIVIAVYLQKKVSSSLNWGNWIEQPLKLLYFSFLKSLTHAYTSCFNPSSRIRSSPSFKKGKIYLYDWSMNLFSGWMRFQEHVEDRDWRSYYVSYYMLTWIL